MTGRLTDHVSIWLLAAVPRGAIDDAVEWHGEGARRSDSKLPAHVMMYFAMAPALFSARRITGRSWPG